MWVKVIGIEDVSGRQVRVASDLGELLVTWLDAGYYPLPSSGEEMDVELTLGLDEADWDRDVTMLSSDTAPAIQQAAQQFLLTGWAEWSREDGVLWLSLATDCLMSVVLDSELGETRTIGMVRLRARTLYLYPTGA